MKKQLYPMLAALLLAASAIPATAQTATSGEMTNTQAFMDKMGDPKPAEKNRRKYKLRKNCLANCVKIWKRSRRHLCAIARSILGKTRRRTANALRTRPILIPTLTCWKKKWLILMRQDLPKNRNNGARKTCRLKKIAGWKKQRHRPKKP